MPTIQQLRYVAEIATCGSVSRAAERLLVAQPSISAAIKDLESELGLTIFHRTNRGMVLSSEGTEFLGYARQVLEQVDLLESRFSGEGPRRRELSVSTQHYAFSVNAFVDLLKDYEGDSYEFTLRETRTHDIIEDVRHLRSEVGVLYLSDFNEAVMRKLFKENDLEFTELFTARPHVFVSRTHPLAERPSITPEELEPYPCLSFEQGTNNSFHFSEEILSTAYHAKSIRVSDRATIFNLIIGLHGYTISTGVLSEDLNGDGIVSVPLDVPERIRVGYIVRRQTMLSRLAKQYLEKLDAYLASYGLK